MQRLDLAWRVHGGMVPWQAPAGQVAGREATAAAAVRPFLAAAARLVLEQLPLWSQCTCAHEVPSMTAELRAFFRFGRRTGRVSHARDWLELVAGDDIDEVLGSFLRTRHWPALPGEPRAH